MAVIGVTFCFDDAPAVYKELEQVPSIRDTVIWSDDQRKQCAYVVESMRWYGTEHTWAVELRLVRLSGIQRPWLPSGAAARNALLDRAIEVIKHEPPPVGTVFEVREDGEPYVEFGDGWHRISLAKDRRLMPGRYVIESYDVPGGMVTIRKLS